MPVAILPVSERSPTWPLDQVLRGKQIRVIFADSLGRILVAFSDSPAEKVNYAADKVTTVNLLDPGTCQERVDTIVTSSASLALSYTDTFAYTLVNGKFVLDTVTRS